MRVPEPLTHAFEGEFQRLISEFAIEKGFLPDSDALESPRFLARAVIPHVIKLSKLFNRDQKDQDSSLDPYWKESSNPANFRLAYFLYFMPSNLFRMASIWAELSRLGFRWSPKELRGVEFGAGPASGVCGIAAGEHYASVGLPKTGNWALIEQDKAILEMGTQWSETYFSHVGFPDWQLRPFHRKLDPIQGFLPPRAPKFNLWLMSFYLNEVTTSAEDLAKSLIADWNNHLEDEGLIILMEPALKLQSRRLLELRKQLLIQKQNGKADWLQILLPCMGHQSCGALSKPEDWCHEEVTWWRPPYFKKIDQMASLDRKTLPFSYLVLVKSRRTREEILPELKKRPAASRNRLVSPAHSEGKRLEFYVCGLDGKRKARHLPKTEEEKDLQRGDLIHIEKKN